VFRNCLSTRSERQQALGAPLVELSDFGYFTNKTPEISEALSQRLRIHFYQTKLRQLLT
jgi:hypothetical protein